MLQAELQAVLQVLRVLPQRERELLQVQVQRVLREQVLQELQELRELLQQVRVLLRVQVQRVLPGELHSQI